VFGYPPLIRENFGKGAIALASDPWTAFLTTMNHGSDDSVISVPSVVSVSLSVRNAGQGNC
jgi:hypothetical protein